MEIMLIAVVAPLIRCEWQLQDWQVALVTTVSSLCSPLTGHPPCGHCRGDHHGLFLLFFFFKNIFQWNKYIPRVSFQGQEQYHNCQITERELM